MKMFFVTGKFANEDDYQLDISTDHGTALSTLMGDAFSKVDVLLERGSVEHIISCEKDVFLIFDPLRLKRELAIERMQKLLKNQKREVLNPEDIHLSDVIRKTEFDMCGNGESYLDDTVFWDILNQYVIVIGEENFTKIGRYFEYLIWSQYHQIDKTEKFSEVFNKNECPLVKKLSKKGY